jgi:hypothetical protein
VTKKSLAHPAQVDSTEERREAQARFGEASRAYYLLYPHPLTLARDHAEAERIRLADSAAYSSMCATWGRLGGLTTLYRWGPSWFRLLAMGRWELISPKDLEATRPLR